MALCYISTSPHLHISTSPHLHIFVVIWPDLQNMEQGSHLSPSLFVQQNHMKSGLVSMDVV